VNGSPFETRHFSSTAGLQPAELIVWVTDVWMDVVKLFQIATPPTVFVRFLRKLAHTIYVPIRKTVEQIFEFFKILCQQ